ncbi:MAG: hypothetical protein LC808_02115 [Actinobacteria bacterium]|nr:hypothetical protein [Actinomycetota bacterium]
MIWHRDRRDDADIHLDQWIQRALDAELVQMDADFDFEAGLANVYARAGLARPRAAESPIQEATDSHSDVAGGSGGQSAVRAVVEHIAMLDALLGAVTSSEEEISPQLGVMYLKMARQFLLQLRMGLTGRRLTRARAIQLVDTIEHDLSETDKILRAQQGLSLQEAVRIRIGELRDVGGDLNQQVQRLREKVLSLFAEVEDPAPRSPIPSR